VTFHFVVTWKSDLDDSRFDLLVPNQIDYARRTWRRPEPNDESKHARYGKPNHSSASSRPHVRSGYDTQARCADPEEFMKGALRAHIS